MLCAFAFGEMRHHPVSRIWLTEGKGTHWTIIATPKSSSEMHSVNPDVTETNSLVDDKAAAVGHLVSGSSEELLLVC